MSHLVRKSAVTIALVASMWLAAPGFGFQIVTEGDKTACQEVRLFKELKIYKDPTLFLSVMSLIQQDPQAGWEALSRENPLLTTVKGTVQLAQLGPEREFKNFGAIARLYEVADPRFRLRRETGSDGRAHLKKPIAIIPIMLCGENDPYKNTMGFVPVEDFKLAQVDELSKGEMPPSVYPNPIPKLRKDRDSAVAPATPPKTALP